MRTNAEQVTSNSRLRPDQDEVTVRVPALRRYVGAVRALTTALAVQCDLTVDEIEDVQMSVDEACALLLPHVDRAQPWLDVRFSLVNAQFVACVEVSTTSTVSVDREDLSWIVLAALCDEVDVRADGQTLQICFTKLRAADQP